MGIWASAIRLVMVMTMVTMMMVMGAEVSNHDDDVIDDVFVINDT